jgi:hypothetical protein
VPPPDPRLPPVEELSPVERALVQALIKIIARDLAERPSLDENGTPRREPGEARW